MSPLLGHRILNVGLTKLGLLAPGHQRDGNSRMRVSTWCREIVYMQQR